MTKPLQNGASYRTLSQNLDRGVSAYGDIAILTRRNEDVVKTTLWLNEKNIDFISYSNLDITEEEDNREIVALLNFLDSPMDDLSFATFINGRASSAPCYVRTILRLARRDSGVSLGYRESPPLYKSFQKEFSFLWGELRLGLGIVRLSRPRVVFLDLRLVTEAYAVFRVFETLGDEEAALVKILEAVKEFEGAGYHSIRDFLDSQATATARVRNGIWTSPKPWTLSKWMTIHKAKGLGIPRSHCPSL